MTKDEAIAWAVLAISGILQYEYYPEKEDANFAAEAMTTLTGKPWHVTSKDDHNWVSPVND